MKGFLVLSVLLAVSQAGYVSLEDGVSGRSIIDPIIKAILEAMRPKLANLSFPDIYETISERNVNATISIKGINLKNADQYVIQNLKSNMIPMRLANLTLTWKGINAKVSYDINSTINIPQMKGPISIYGQGDAKAALNGVFLTIGANMELKNKAIQIKPRGLFGFDISVGNANVTFGSLMGSTELGTVAGNFLSRVIPGLVDDIKKPLFDAFQDDIIRAVNDVLKKNGTTFLHDEEIVPEVMENEPFNFFDLENQLNSLEESLESEESSFDIKY